MASTARDDQVRCSACGEDNPSEAKFCGKCGRPVLSAMPKPGDIIADRYRMVARIGQGAMGTVYRAEHVQISKVMAIKLLRPELEQNPENVIRFHRDRRDDGRRTGSIVERDHSA